MPYAMDDSDLMYAMAIELGRHGCHVYRCEDNGILCWKYDASHSANTRKFTFSFYNSYVIFRETQGNIEDHGSFEYADPEFPNNIYRLINPYML
jgi:hypothetical protein